MVTDLSFHGLFFMDVIGYRVMKIFATTPLSPSVRVPSKSARKVSSIASNEVWYIRLQLDLQ